MKHLFLILFIFASFGFSPAHGKAKRTPANNLNHFKKVMIVVFENEDFAKVLDQPAFKEIAKRGALLENYHAVAHPSQPNYLALTAGSTLEIVDDAKYTKDVKHIGDLLEEKNKTWKVYAESYPGNCMQDERMGPYVRKHTPFLTYANVTNNLERCSKHVVEASQLFVDIKNNTVPDYSLYIPNMNNDGHDTNIQFADTWLKQIFIGKYRKSQSGEGGAVVPLLQIDKLMQDMLFVFTFDESGVHGDEERKKDPNFVYTVFLGPTVQPGTYNEDYTHYSLLRTIEENFGLDNLGTNDVNAKVISGIWK